MLDAFDDTFKQLLHRMPPSFSSSQLDSNDLQKPSRKDKFTEFEIKLFKFMLSNRLEKSTFRLGEHGLGKTSWANFEKRWKRNLKSLKAWSLQGQSPFPKEAFFLRSATQLKEKFKYLQKLQTTNFELNILYRFLVSRCNVIEFTFDISIQSIVVSDDGRRNGSDYTK